MRALRLSASGPRSSPQGAEDGGNRPRRRWIRRTALVVIALVALVLAYALVPPLGGFDSITCAGTHDPRCRSSTGRVIYLQRHDPDGGGDLHVVILTGRGVTFPMASVMKFRRGNRPRPAVGIGDWVSARGYMLRGSHGSNDLVVLKYRIAY